MIAEGKEAIGSMGDTARLAIFSREVRSFFDYFYHNFAQVTNPPLDYIRERLVTDLRMYLGKRPNIFAKKELLPAPVAFEVPSPVLSLGTLAYLASLKEENTNEPRILSREFDTTFRASQGEVGFRSRLKQLAKEVKQAVSEGVSIIILTDKNANYENLPIPCLLALRVVATEMRDSGMRLKFSTIVHSGELRTTHQIATTIGMGASAVCPYLALEIAREETHKDVAHLTPEQREKNLIKAYEDGLLKIMAKMGISVVRSYQSSRLFTSIGIAEDLIQIYFEGVTPKLGGIGWHEIVHDLIEKSEKARLAEEANTLPNAYIFKEHSRGLVGEKHSMTASRSKIVHELVRKTGLGLDNWELYREYLKASDQEEPVSVRHLFALKKAPQPPKGEKSTESEAIEVPPSGDRGLLESILATFGSGAMSYGAISAEAQRDIFLAMQAIGGRSNSGEGGENPYYYTEGITAHTKQVASGRFGANALYLIAGKEIQIKVAQGAKPGEGGQLMGAKVDAEIAKARYATAGIDLISPPPLHDIYSIEDLKELIYELRQLHPEAHISVKLVAGAGIGTIAVGVAKAGADIIHVSGGEGGTGAATLSSMKHAGLPWELGLWEVHQTLLANGLRSQVILRTDGGLHSGKEILTAAILGAEQYDFGKLLLVAQGCVMARVCEKNTCPTGIATHDARFKAKYQGTKEHIVTMLKYLAEDVRNNLAEMGFANIREIIGRTDLLEENPHLYDLIRLKRLDLGFILDEPSPYLPSPTFAGNTLFAEGLSELNESLASPLTPEGGTPTPIKITVQNRAIPATLAGKLAKEKHETKVPPSGVRGLLFEGSAGQGFGVFLTEGIELQLFGEANDSVGKMMSGGKIVICPSKQARFKAEENVIIGNVALYGATGGTLYVNGIAADRFAVRNSGATAVVEGVGMHACEYMTRGKVVILGETSHNVGGGMTGGELILIGNKDSYINRDYIAPLPFEAEELAELKTLLQDYQQATQSKRAQYLLENWDETQHYFVRYVPKAVVKKREENLVA
jgi:glutamate synthase domain-containing protein 2/glutamate synthase domain-containing protein 3